MTWIPTSIVYTSERFLYLPSVAFFGILVLSISKLTSSTYLRKFGQLFGVITLSLVIFYGSLLFVESYLIADSMWEADIILSAFDPLFHEEIVGKDNIFILNFFDAYTGAVFLEDMIRVRYNNDNLTVMILTITPNETEGMDISIERIDNKTLEITSETPLFSKNFLGFESRKLNTGDWIEMKNFRVNILSVSEKGVEKLRFYFNDPLEDSIFLFLNPLTKTFKRLTFD